MSGISTSSSDSHEFILIPEQPPPSTLVTVGQQVANPIPITSSRPPHSTGPPSSPPRTHRRLVKRSHVAEEASPPPLSPSSPPHGTPSTPPAPPVSSSSGGGHSRKASSSPGRSSPRERSPPVIAPHESLVGDVQMSRTRVIISKTHTIYDPVGIPFRSALIGFRATFHSPPAASARVRDAEITLRFLSSSEGQPAPIIKAICPTSQGIGPSTSITDSVSTTAGVHLGYTPGGNLQLSRTASTVYTHQTQARIASSGVETNELWLTLREDPTSRQGIPSTVDFATLIRLTSPPPFEAELSVGVTIGRGPQALLKMLSSPSEWIALYDGSTTLNPLSLSTPASSQFRPSGLVTNQEHTVTVEEDVEMDGTRRKDTIRVVNRKPSSLELC
ncbi:uncharacterized protein JCM6883_005152 [Sporobolomyces salmoneus]|uniref:uncharacterized protein n=1 Tax=Sporobolomyces salmoneus TaxID=183962 RepID=UPI0031775D11